MCRKLTHVIAFALVLGQVGYGDLVAHWDLEEGSGTTTTAAVGSPDADGTLVGATWVTTGLAAIDGTTAAVFFNSASSDRVETNYAGITGQAARTVAAWIKAEPTQNNNAVIVGWGVNSTTERYGFRLNGTASNGPLWALRLEISGSRSVATTPLNDGQWHHVVVTHGDGATIDDARFYLDGQVEEVTGTSGGGLINTGSSSVVLGNSGHGVGTYGFDGAIDEVRIYDHVLSPDEIKQLAFRPRAHASDPADGAAYEDTWATLRWSPGDEAVSHDVYLGENLADVRAGTADTFQGNQTPEYLMIGLGLPGDPYPTGFVPGSTYYWRVDEVSADGKIYEGDVWSFTIPPTMAYGPVPADGVRFVNTDVTLSWMAGFKAGLHYVYFGDNAADVQAGTGGTDKGSVPGTTHTPGTLARDTTYYWRIDEFDGSAIHKGEVWSFTTLPDIPITDPNLVGWWMFNEGEGTTAVDWSGHNHHGAILGVPQWVEGYDSYALEFGGVSGQRVEMLGYDGVVGTQDRTVTAWIKTTGLGDFISWGQNVTSQKWSCRLEAGAANGTVGALRAECSGGYITGSTDLRDGHWHHITAVLQSTGSPTITDIALYVDGWRETISGSQAVDINTASGRNVWIGDAHHDRPFPGLIDDARIYDKALTEDEIRLVMRIDPLLAWNPSPLNGSTADVDEAVPLTWSPGDNVAQHDVYFGTDRDAVSDAGASTAGIYRGRQSAAGYAPPEGVEWGGGPYYWRIDEYNTDGTISEGRVWSFSVADFILVDDFEDYDTDDDQIWYAWRDGLGYGAVGNPPYYAGNGTGAEVGDGTTDSYTEEGIVYGGAHSMPYWFNNNKPGYFNYSEAKMTLTPPGDWSNEGVKALSLWFRGYPVSTGSFTEGPVGAYTMTGSGTDIWDVGPAAGQYGDEFHFAYKQLSGAGSIVTRVESVENTNGWAKAGVMIRDTLDANSVHAMMVVTPAQGVSFQRRTIAGEASASDTQGGITAPQWVKIERDMGGNMTASYSADGISWTQQGIELINMNTPIYIGLAVTSHDAALTCEAVFSNVTITGNVGAVWAHQDIGIASNDAEPMYVAIANSTGQPAVVHHDEPNATQIDTWTEWNIDLKDFADKGINLADVNSIAIGFGDRDNPVAGGAGKMYFDDIRLYRSRCVPDKVTLSAADFNGDCIVDMADVELMAADWLAGAPALAADLNADGAVDFKDYSALAEEWLDEQLWPEW